MTYTVSRAKAIKCLSDGNIQHVARDRIDEKNLLQCGDLSPQDVIKLLNATRMNQHRIEPHEDYPAIDVYYFEPEAKIDSDEVKHNWHIKLFFIDPSVFFISVHRSHIRKRTGPSQKNAKRRIR